jgi:glucose/arabinose dehydrogenase
MTVVPLLFSFATSCGSDGGDANNGGTRPAAGVETLVTGLTDPVFLTSPPSDSRLFIVEKPGRIRIYENGALAPTPFLDVTALVSTGDEQGLLGLAFHPSYATNGLFYVNYTDAAGDTQVVRYSVGTTPNQADSTSATGILTVDQPFANHNGGMVFFGADGKLYIALGDGGDAGDPAGNAQNLGTLLGKLLRIDVDGGAPYAVPADNPFVGTAGARGEIWALGLRNPWRLSTDRATNLLYLADVGQGAWEEVNVVPASQGGVNYGWDVMEGGHCFEPSAGCDQTGLALPVSEYDHVPECSVTGGYVYRGAAIPALQGTYFYADYCAGWVRSFRYDNGTASAQQEWDFGDLGQILSFGEDSAGELYILSVLSGNGGVYRIVPNP